MAIEKIDAKLESSILEWCNNAVKKYPQTQTARMYVLDIGITQNNEWIVVEMNSFSSSGFYKCNVDEIVKSVSTL
jgi:hypothetical protein